MYEYKVVSVYPLTLEATLNKWAEAGWRFKAYNGHILILERQ